jgi:hypothetical protein
VLVLLLAPSPIAAQDLDFLGLEMTGQPARLPSAQVVTLSKDDGELLRLLATACRENLGVLRNGSKDKKGRSFLDQEFQPYETRKNAQGHLMIVGTLFHNSFKGFSSEKNPMHDFTFDPALARSMQSTLPYLKAIARHASANGAKFLTAYQAALRDLATAHVKGAEATWRQVPMRGVHTTAAAYGRLATLAQLADYCRAKGRSPAAVRATLQTIDGLLEFCVTALGLSQAGDSVDSQRAASAFACVSKGTGYLVSHLPGVNAKDTGYALKPELERTLARLLVVERGNADVASALTANLARPLTSKIWISPSVTPSSRLSQEATMLVLRVSMNLAGLKKVLQAF